MTNQLFEQAKTYIFTHGRGLDQALFAYHFMDGSEDGVLNALATFQNEDGGFGHGLEPDIRTPASSVIATAHAFAIFRELKTPASHVMVQQAVDFLLEQFDAQKNIWQIVPLEVELAPHAPWWTYDATDQAFGQFLTNPRAQIIGCLYDYVELVPADFLPQISARLLEHMAGLPDELFKNDFLCYLILAESENLPNDLCEQVQQKLLSSASASIVEEPSRWKEYVLRPLGVISSPDSFLTAAVSQAAIEANLDYLVAQQLPDGSWPLPWSWAQVDGAAWSQAERDWKGAIAVEYLRLLQAFAYLPHLST